MASRISLIKYQPDYFDRWNKFVEESNNGTIFHRLDFLAYHGNKFEKNEHHLIWVKGEEIFAVMPMGIFEEDGKRIARSPFGASWGGVVQSPRFPLKHAVPLVEKLLEYLRAQRIDELVVTMTSPCYYTTYSTYVEFALSKLGFRITNRDITSVVAIPSDKNVEEVFKSSGRNQARKAEKKGFDIHYDQDIDILYDILLDDKGRHSANPTHTLDDLRCLKRTFPDRIRADLAYLDGRPLAGVLYFVCNSVCEVTFYLCQRAEVRELYPMNLLVLKGMQRAKEEGFRYFDFGNSTLNMEICNIGVATFKENFGAGGQFRETYSFTF